MNIQNSMRAELSQKQMLVMTQQMKQSLEMLRMPLIELQEYLTNAAGENPLLELEYPDVQEIPEQQTMQIEDAEDIRWSTEYTFQRAGGGESGTDTYDPFAGLAYRETFAEMLSTQIAEMSLPEGMAEQCDYIIHSLTPRGYLEESAAELAEELEISAFDAEQAIYVVQSLSPIGVGARDLQECLILQLALGSDFNQYTLKIVREGLELLGARQYAKLAKLLGVSIDETQQYCASVRALNPIPSRGYATGSPSQYVLPEAEILRENGTLHIHYYEEALPRIHLQEDYKSMMGTLGDEVAEKYLKKNAVRAEGLIRDVEQRTATIVRVIREIATLQADYFEKGAAYLKPMTSLELAQRLELAPSTISRAISGKYIVCRNGTIAIRSLFTARLEGGSSALASAGSAKERLRQLVQMENKAAPLSDEELRQRMEALGISLSRRTVAKYREELELPAAYARKQRA